MEGVFICYHPLEDVRDLLPRISVKLKEEGISCYYYVGGRPSGDDVVKIQTEIKNCRVFLFLWDNGANQDKWCKHEVKSAFDAKRTIIVFRLGLQEEDEDSDLKIYCNRAKHIDGGFSPKGANLNDLIPEIVHCFGNAC